MLIKAVAQVVLACTINVFKIPMGICNDIQKAIARY